METTKTTEKTTETKAFQPPQAKFVLAVRDASIAVLRHQDVAIKFYTMFKEATDTYSVTELQFLHYFDASIPSAYDAKAVPPVTSKTIGHLPAFNRLKYMLRVGSVGIKRTIPAAERNVKAEAREKAFVEFIKAAKLTRALANTLLKLVDTGKQKRFTARVIGAVWPVTTAEVQAAPTKAKGAKTA